MNLFVHSKSARGETYGKQLIKVEVITPDKPEIFQIAEILALIQMLFLESWFVYGHGLTSATIDGNAGSVTKGAI